MPVPLSPVQVLQRAEAVWHAQQLPPYVQFTSRVQDQDDPVIVIVRTSDGAAYTKTIPQSPGEAAFVAPGAHLTGPYGAPLGFCISQVRCSGVLQTDPFLLPPPAPPDAPKVIANTYAYGNAYALSFGPTKKYQDHAVIDLVMRPNYDPQRYQLREMLVEAADYRVLQLTYEAAKVRPGVFLRYDFGPVEDTWYLQFICVVLPDRVKSPGPQCSLESTRLWNFALPAYVPDWYFDPVQYRQHVDSTP